MCMNARCIFSKTVCLFFIAWVASVSVCHAGILNFLAPSGDDAEKQLQTWLHSPTQDLKLGEWDRLRLAPSYSEHPNQHPLTITAEQVADMLKTLQLKSDGEVIALFAEDELKRLSKPIASALAVARPDQDVEFLSTGQHGMIGIVAPVVGNAGRIFVTGGRLNIILGMVHKDFISDYLHGSRRVPKFDYGSQQHPAEYISIASSAPGDVHLVRQDWVALPMPAKRAEKEPARPTIETPPGNGPMVAPGKDAAEDLASKLAVRLKALQLLKEQGLLSEEEYRNKRAAILQGM